MLCEPTVNDEMADDVAAPLFKMAGAPKLLAPSLNCTMPVGVPEPGSAAETVAVNVTICPKEDGLTEDETLVELASWFTVCASEGLVLPLKLASPR